MKLATTTGDYFAYTNSQAEAIQHIKNAGFKYIDYNFCLDYNKNVGIFGENYEEYIKEITLTCKNLGVKLVQAHAPMGRPFEDGGKLLEKTLRCVDACGAWGIKNIVVHSGYSAGLSKEETFKRNKEFYMPLLARAEKYGINILTENFNKMCDKNIYWIDNATDLLELIEFVNHPLFHAVWDTGHGNLQEMPQDEAIRLLGDHIKAVHIQDNNGDWDSHLAPFLGTLNLDSVMNGLFEIGYGGYFTFEVGNFFTPAKKRRLYEKSTLLASAPLELRNAFQQYLYKLGQCVLKAYNCFEE